MQNKYIKLMKIEDVILTKKLGIAKKTVLNVMVTESVLSDHLNLILKKHKLSPEQYNVLRILRGQKGNPINMSDIQIRMIHKNSNTTRLVDKLILKNMVTRTTCLDNKRKMEVLITSVGLEILQILDPYIEEFDQVYTKNLNNEELELLNQLLDKFRG